MSKGGAGKVYFVLYLAVILELLIIFIERDEAEESLNRERQQAIEIVQTILSQLQTGTGATGITATPKDNIVLSEKEPAANIRNYEVTVSVGDRKAVSMVDGKEVRGDDISKLEYIVSHIGDPLLPDDQLGADTADIENGNVIFKAELGTEIGSYTEPHQTFGVSIPAENPQGYFMLNEVKTQEQVSKGRKVKVFIVNFKPNQGKGWYRLRFHSETNKILGITGGEPGDGDTVRIGNVKLTVGQLRQVQKALRKQKAGGAQEQSQVEQYITTLLTPGGYKTFDENRGFTSFNVNVTIPEAEKPQEPVAEIIFPRDTIYWYNVAPFTVPVKLGPKDGSRNISGGARLTEMDPTRNLYLATIDNPVEGVTPIIAKAENAGKFEQSERQLVVAKPEVRGGIKRWRGLKATVSRKYNPSSEWMSTAIPEDQYETVVEMNGKVVFERAGVTFKESDLPGDLMVTEGTREIKTTVFWKPNGTTDRAQWKALLSSGGGAVHNSDNPIEINYPVPEQLAGFEFDWILSPKNLSPTFEPIELRQKIGDNRFVGVQATASCPDCAEYGIQVRMSQVDETKWSLAMDIVDQSKLKPTISGKRFDVVVNMSGRGGASGTGVVTITVKIAGR